MEVIFYSRLSPDTLYFPIQVLGLSMDGKANLSRSAATIFREQPNASFVPLELWWSEGRRDYQNVASKASRY